MSERVWYVGTTLEEDEDLEADSVLNGEPVNML